MTSVAYLPSASSSTEGGGTEGSKSALARTVSPSPALRPEGRDTREVLTQEQVASWTNRGFALVDDVIPRELIDEAAREAESCLLGKMTGTFDFGSGIEFPHEETPAINQVAINERLIHACAQLLRCEPTLLRIYQSDVWAKHAEPLGHKRKSGE